MERAQKPAKAKKSKHKHKKHKKKHKASSSDTDSSSKNGSKRKVCLSYANVTAVSVSKSHFSLHRTACSILGDMSVS